MNYTKGKQSYLNKNKFIVKVMMLYIDDFEFLFQCLEIDNEYVLMDIEDVIVHLIDFQGDDISYTPLTIA